CDLAEHVVGSIGGPLPQHVSADTFGGGGRRRRGHGDRAREHRACQPDTGTPHTGTLARDERVDRANQQPVSKRAGDSSSSAGASYATSGVDIEAGDRAVELLKPLAKKASRPEVVGELGGFAGLFALKGGYREPLLAASTDGVGTKVAIAQAMDKHDTVGLDLVAMFVDDIAVCAAGPLLLQDYTAVAQIVPARRAELGTGIAGGCVQAGCALLGGETAEHPGLMAPGAYDISATGIGVVEADNVLGPERVRPGDVVIGMASTGLHSNGYSLTRHVLLEIDRM